MNIELLIILIILFYIIFLYIFPKKNYEKIENTIYSNVSNRMIGIIYFAYLKHASWNFIVLEQLKNLLATNILSHSDLYISLTGIEIDVNQAKKLIKELLHEHLQHVHFSFNYENAYEYPGIKILYEEGIKNPNKVYLYFHSKGMVYHDNSKRSTQEIVLFDVMINNWISIISIFNSKPEINKVCYGACSEGFCWFNFFWVRGKYMLECKPPIKTDIRHYYESYLSRSHKNGTYLDCYNIKKEKAYYSVDEINRLITVEYQTNYE